MSEHYDDTVWDAVDCYLGRQIHTVGGVLLGNITDVLGDVHSGAPQWLVLRLPGLRRARRAVPIGLCLESRGRLIMPTSRAGVRHGPALPPEACLTAQDELDLRAYWSDR